MAKADYTVADRNTDALEAGDKIQETVQATPDADAAAFAEAAGVSHPAYVDYATALDAHAARADIEGLAERRAREYGTSFGEADFMRDSAYNADGTAAAAPRPGTVYGDAPDAGGQFGASDSNTSVASTNPTGDADADTVANSADAEPNDPTIQ